MGQNLCIMRANYLHTSRRVRWVCLLLYSSCFTNVQLTRWYSCGCIYPLLWAGLLGEDLGDGLNCVQVKTCCDHTQFAESSGPLSFASHVCILGWNQEKQFAKFHACSL